MRGEKSSNAESDIHQGEISSYRCENPASNHLDLRSNQANRKEAAWGRDSLYRMRIYRKCRLCESYCSKIIKLNQVIKAESIRV